MSESQTSGGQGDSALLTDPALVKSDLRMIGRAIRMGWPISPDMKATVVERMAAIVKKTEVEVVTADGVVASENHADQNAISAARVLVAAEAQNQADDHLTDKNTRLDGGGATERIDHTGTITETQRRLAQAVLEKPEAAEAARTLAAMIVVDD